MRPSDAFGRPRPADADGTPSLQAPSGPQMSFFLGDETAMDVSLEQSLQSTSRPRESRKQQAPSRLETRPEAADKAGPSAEGFIEGTPPALADEYRPATPTCKSSGTPTSHAHVSVSQPMTPILLGASGPASLLSSYSSRRNSLEGSLSGDMESASISIAGDGNMEQSSTMMDSGSAPQLVMPSIKMPSRRPFTEEGKSMGRLKVLVAGDSGIGKTSLIKAIVQSCVHIVHVDPITPPTMSLVPRSSPKARPRSIPSRSNLSTSHITEIYASTKPYPEWWSDIDDIRVLQRRKSLGDAILDRNICFVDTPGYSGGSSAMETITPLIQYVQSYLHRLCSNSLGDSDFLNLLGGDGGSHVDVVFYLISSKLKPVDLEYIRQLSQMTNIIPLVGRADTMPAEQLTELKRQIASQLQESDIRPFTFSARGPGASMPYAVSSAPGSDHETMDASLLMSPDYVQPLIPTELGTLVDQVFCQNGASWLRHSAARKFVQWRSSNSPQQRPQALYRPLSLPSATGVGPGAERGAVLATRGRATSFAMAEFTDHSQREERMAQIRLANWAQDLQRSLANERARYESLARSERAVWLTERLNECVQDGTLVAVSGHNRSRSRVRDHLRHGFANRRRASGKGLHPQDPLGLLEVAADLKSKSWRALEVLGGLGVIGGLAFWMTRQYGHLQTYEWAVDEWWKFWYGDR